MSEMQEAMAGMITNDHCEVELLLHNRNNGENVWHSGDPPGRILACSYR